MPTTVLIIDDDQKLNALLKDYLSRFQLTVLTSEDPYEGLAIFRQSPPSLIILDLMLPEMDGFAVCREIRKTSAVPINMLTARGDLPDRVAGLELGADDYLAKPFEPRELVARIQSVLRRSGSLGPSSSPTERLKAEDLTVNLRSRSAWLDGRDLDLTTMEFEILALFLHNPGAVLSREEIMERVRGIDWEAFNRSIDVTVSRLRQKLHDDPKHPRYIKTIWGAGYQFLPAFSDLHIEESFSIPGTLVSQYRRHPFVILTRGDSTFGIFFLHRPFGNLPVWSFALLVGLIGTVIAGSYLMVRQLIRPVNWLTQGVGEIAKGHFDHQVPIRSSDELGELTKSFNDMAQRVSEMIQSPDRLLLDVSHELRSPLTRMKVATEFIQNELAKEKIQQEVRELEMMVTELLETERLKSSPGSLTLTDTDLVTLVKEVTQTYSDVKPGVRFDSPHGSIRFPLDRHRIMMALRNLIENALKHSRLEHGLINIKIQKYKDSVEMLIQDFVREFQWRINRTFLNRFIGLIHPEHGTLGDTDSG